MSTSKRVVFSWLSILYPSTRREGLNLSQTSGTPTDGGGRQAVAVVPPMGVRQGLRGWEWPHTERGSPCSFARFLPPYSAEGGGHVASWGQCTVRPTQAGLSPLASPPGTGPVLVTVLKRHRRSVNCHKERTHADDT